MNYNPITTDIDNKNEFVDLGGLTMKVFLIQKSGNLALLPIKGT